MIHNLIEIKELEIAYRMMGKVIPAAGPLTLQIRKGEALGLIGESGAGKTTVAMGILGILSFRGGFFLKGKIEYKITQEQISYIPQDPAASLDPLFSIGNQVHEITRDAQSIRDAFERVHLPMEKISFKSYPHELSGGMKQRLLIAMALLRRPKLIIADEPTSALDVTLQAEIMKLFSEIKSSGAAFLFVTHHLPLAKMFCDRVGVMQKGLLLEEGTPETVFRHPQTSYTKALTEAVPVMKR